MSIEIPQLRMISKGDLNSKFRTINWNPCGKVTNVVGTVVEARLPHGRIGMIVEIILEGGQPPLLAEVVGLRDGVSLLLPFSNLTGISAGATVNVVSLHDNVEVGDHLIGSVVDPFLQPLTDDFATPPDKKFKVELDKAAPNPLKRSRIEHTFSLGIRAIDGVLTFGEGQRVGIMAGSGVGKSVLMGMIAKGSDADYNVIALIGERGREVREFVEKELGPEGLKRSVVVVVTGDQSPLLRIRGAKVATSIAEYLSSRGKRVLLMMDSLTRVAMAQREIGLAIGEPPTAKGYPPSVFAMLPRLLERCGPQPSGHGSISGLYTVLVDGDDFNDPMPDAARGILDGHIQLSRDLANKGHYPAIDITGSASRVMKDVVSERHWDLALTLKELIAVYNENYDYVQIGSYQPGSNPKMDVAIKMMPTIEDYLRQSIHERSNYDNALEKLETIFTNAIADQQKARQNSSR